MMKHIQLSKSVFTMLTIIILVGGLIGWYNTIGWHWFQGQSNSLCREDSTKQVSQAVIILDTQIIYSAYNRNMKLCDYKLKVLSKLKEERKLNKNIINAYQYVSDFDCVNQKTLEENKCLQHGRYLLLTSEGSITVEDKAHIYYPITYLLQGQIANDVARRLNQGDKEGQIINTYLDTFGITPHLRTIAAVAADAYFIYVTNRNQ